MNSNATKAQTQLHSIALTACILSGLGFFTAGLTAIAGLYLACFVRLRTHSQTPGNTQNLTAVAEILGLIALLIYTLPLLLSIAVPLFGSPTPHLFALGLLAVLALLAVPLLLFKWKDLSHRRLYRRTIAENLNR